MCSTDLFSLELPFAKVLVVLDESIVEPPEIFFHHGLSPSDFAVFSFYSFSDFADFCFYSSSLLSDLQQ